MKGKEKAGIYTKFPSDKPMSPPSLEALLSDPSLFEEIPMEDPDDGFFSSLVDLFNGEAVQGARYMMKDPTSFKFFAAVSVCFLVIML